MLRKTQFFLNSTYQRITMNLIRQWFVFVAHVSHSSVKVAHNYCLCVNGCIVLDSKVYKPQEMTGESVCFITLVLLSPLCSCCKVGGGVSQVHCRLPTVRVVASMQGSIKKINGIWQPRDTYTYHSTMETSTVSERDAVWLIPGKSFNPSNSIIVVFFSPLSVRKKVHLRSC